MVQSTASRALAILALVSVLAAPVSAAMQSTLWQDATEAGLHAYQRGDYSQAESHLRLALREAEGFGINDTRLPASLDSLGRVLLVLRNYAEAEGLFARTVRLRLRVLGPDNPIVAVIMHQQAIAIARQGRFEESAPLYERAIAVLEASYGPADTSLQLPLVEYAEVLAALGRNGEAIEMRRRAGLAGMKSH